MNVFHPPKEDFGISVLSAAVNFVSKRPVAGPAMMLDANEMNAHLQSRFGSQVSAFLHECFEEIYTKSVRAKLIESANTGRPCVMTEAACSG